jgi:hypothetical protein
MARRGAGGTQGGELGFLLGIVMMIGGGYLLLNAIVVRPNFGFGTRAFGAGVPVTSGMVLIVFMFGVGFIFYDRTKWVGWILAVGSVIGLIFGVIASTTLQFANMSVFDLLVILVLLFGGVGLFLRSLLSR